jgi:hypothetical protein
MVVFMKEIFLRELAQLACKESLDGSILSYLYHGGKPFLGQA